MSEDETRNGGVSPPRENLIRAAFPAELELRETQSGPPVLEGHFAKFDEWTRIDSVFEGTFMERIAPGAFKKTLKEGRDKIRVLFQHGRDQQIGDKVLGKPEVLEEDAEGARYEVPLFDTSYNRDLLPGLKAGVYGASFRFAVVREEFDQHPERSAINPDGIPERTITEARVMEFGPVTFPAYDGATAGVRSLTMRDLDRGLTTDDIKPVNDHYPQPEDEQPPEPTDDEELEVFVELEEPEDTTDGRAKTNAETEAAPPHPPSEVRRDTQPVEDHGETKQESVMNIDEMYARRDDLRTELDTIASENVGERFDAETQARWNQIREDHDDVVARIQETEERTEYLRSIQKDEAHVERGTAPARRDRVNARDKAPDNVFDMAEYQNRANSQDHLSRMYTEGAKRAQEQMYFPHPDANQEDVNTHLERLLNSDSLDKEIAQRVLVMGSPTYRSAFWKNLMKMPLSAQEQNAMIAASLLEARSVLTANTGGVTVPIQIDPTLIPTSNGVLNPFRAIARNVQTTSYIWQGVTQAGVSFTYRAEGATMADNAPTLVARPIQPERADAFIPFSWEVGQDWGALESELAQAIQDGKDAAEATQFAVGAGHGSNAPQGVLVGAGTVVGTSGNTVLAVGDVYALEAALPPRYQANASWLMTNASGQKVRQLVAAAGPAQWGDSLAVGQPERLIGHPIYKASTVGTAGAALTSSARWAIIGDFSRYVIVDRIGLGIRTIDNLFAGNTAGGLSYPVGMSGVVAFYRNSAGVVDSNAFRVGTIT